MLIDAHAHVDRFGPDRSRGADIGRPRNPRPEDPDRCQLDGHRIVRTDRFPRRRMPVDSSRLRHPSVERAALRGPPARARRSRRARPRSSARSDWTGDLSTIRPATRRRKRCSATCWRRRRRGIKSSFCTPRGPRSESLSALEESGNERVVVHWYSGPADIFSQMADRGFYFTVGLEVWHSDRIQRIAREIPAERLLSETDNPGGPKWLTGKPGNPMLIREVVRGWRGSGEPPCASWRKRSRGIFSRLIGRDPALADSGSGSRGGKRVRSRPRSRRSVPPESAIAAPPG